MSKRLLFLAGGLLAAGAITAGILTLRNNQNSSMMSSASDKAALQSMMGVSSANQLPIKTASDQKVLQPTINGGVKEFALTAEPILWEYQKGKTITAWAFNGQVPGPEIRVTEGDKVKITFTNKLPKATTVHWHGLDVPNSMDGVPGVTQAAIKPGASFTYEFTATPAGTHFYHTHGSKMGDEAQQSDMGLSGAFIVEPKGYQMPNKEYTLVLDDWLKGPGNFNMAMQDMNMNSGMANMNAGMANMNYNLLTINGTAFPDTKPLDVKQGDNVRIRLINASAATIHPMHLHGHQFKIVATDGNPVPPAAQLTRNVVTLNPGETYDIEFTANNPGVWAFHCHELHHAGNGMLTLLKYEGFSAPVSTQTPTNSAPNNMGGTSMPGMNH